MNRGKSRKICEPPTTEPDSRLLEYTADIAGRGIANPFGAIWSAVLMLEHLGEKEAADRLMRAVEAVCREGVRTRDVGGSATTSEVGDAVAARV